MYGLEAISHHNGWAMALTGALIVMSGLAILSFIISQLHKLVDRPFRRSPKTMTEKGAVSAEGASAADATENATCCWPLDMPRTAEHLKALTASLGSEFQLTDLYSVFNQNDLPHPHLTINCLRDAGLLKPRGEGVFSWN